jgi:hypothetical protein
LDLAEGQGTEEDQDFAISRQRSGSFAYNVAVYCKGGGREPDGADVLLHLSAKKSKRGALFLLASRHSCSDAGAKATAGVLCVKARHCERWASAKW